MTTIFFGSDYNGTAQIPELKKKLATFGKVIDVVIKKAKEAVASDIREGTGPVSSALRQTFPTQLRRGA